MRTQRRSPKRLHQGRRKAEASRKREQKAGQERRLGRQQNKRARKRTSDGQGPPIEVSMDAMVAGVFPEGGQLLFRATATTLQESVRVLSLDPVPHGSVVVKRLGEDADGHEFEYQRV